MADPLWTGNLIEGLENDAMHEGDLRKALEALKKSLDREGIPFAVIGALAMRAHGYRRFTEDIDILTTREGLDRIHDRLIGRGLSPRAQGLRKQLRDTINKVNIDVIQSGERAGSDQGALVFPDPGSAGFHAADSGVRYPTLPTLVSFKLASGIWGARLKDFADVIALIQVRSLDESFAVALPDYLRGKFIELLAMARIERPNP